MSERGAGSGLGLRFLWIYLFGWLKSNIQTILVLPDSGRLRFPLNIWGRAALKTSPHFLSRLTYKVQRPHSSVVVSMVLTFLTSLRQLLCKTCA